MTLAVLLLALPGLAAANLLQNPGFEQMYEDGGARPMGWDWWANTWSVTVDDQNATLAPIEGERMEIIMGAWWGPWANSGVVQSFAVNRGDVFTLSGYSYATSAFAITGEAFAVAKIEFWDHTDIDPATEQPIAFEEVRIADINTPQDIWAPFSVTAAAPTAAVLVRPVLMFLQPAGSENGAVMVDDVVFVPEPAAAAALALGILALRRRMR
jgi:hypothetical protein